jgi:hypothetical protein
MKEEYVMLNNFEIHIDSDGVLADFEGFVFSEFGKFMREYNKEKGKFWKRLAWYNDNVKPFFLNLPKMKDADDLVAFCTKNCKNVKVLTATGHTPKDVGEQKTQWYAKHYPHLEVVLVRKSLDKAQYAHEKAILIDDRMKAIGPWRDAGGIGILHKNAKDTIVELQNIIKG